MLARTSYRAGRCLAHAERCRTRAIWAPTVEDRAFYKKLEQKWSSLAHSFQVQERLSTFTDHAETTVRMVRLPHPSIPRVKCAECGRLMRLMSIAPLEKSEPAADWATYECKCGETYRGAFERKTMP